MEYKKGQIPEQIQKTLDDTEFSPQKMKEIEYESMGDDDIRHYYPNSRILTYSQLKHFQHLDELIPHDKDYFFLLFQESQFVGHWCLVANNNGVVEFFCSYGSSPSAPLKWNKDRNMSLGIYKPYLDILLSGIPEEVVYNPIDYQNNKDLKVSTCGRHCCFRLMCLLKYDMGLEDYYKMMKQIKDDDGLKYDEIVSEYINKL